MTDHDSDDDLQDEAPTARSSAKRAWLKALLVFAAALVCGLITSLLWMRLHPQPVKPPASATAVMLDPVHRALPAPMTGVDTSLPPPTTRSPDAPHIVATTPPPQPPAVESSDSQGSASASDASGLPPPASADCTASDPTNCSHSEIAPDVVARTQPAYPADALRAGEEGSVQLRISLDAQGGVVAVEVARSSHFGDLDRAAVEAARNWHFAPAVRDGMHVPSTVFESVNFRLDAQP